MKVKSLSVVLVAVVSLTACQSSSVNKTGAVKDVWAGKARRLLYRLWIVGSLVVKRSPTN